MTGLRDLGSQAGGQARAPVVGAPTPNRWTTDNLRPQGIAIRVRPPGGPHLIIKTQLYTTGCKLQCWISQAKLPATKEYSTTHQKKKKNETTKKCVTDKGAR